MLNRFGNVLNVPLNFGSGGGRMLVLYFAVLVLSGCEGVERHCAGFYHPGADDWSMVTEIGDSANYQNITGDAVTLTLAEQIDSEPYTGYDRFSKDDIVCNMESVRRYTFDDGQTGLAVTFHQIEGFGEPIKEQSLRVNVRPESPLGTKIRVGFVFYVDPREFREFPVLVHDETKQTVRHNTNVTIGGSFYARAVEAFYFDTTSVAENAPTHASAITRVIFAEGGGLVEFERLDGQVYTRSDVP